MSQCSSKLNKSFVWERVASEVSENILHHFRSFAGPSRICILVLVSSVISSKNGSISNIESKRKNFYKDCDIRQTCVPCFLLLRLMSLRGFPFVAKSPKRWVLPFHRDQIAQVFVCHWTHDHFGIETFITRFNVKSSKFVHSILKKTVLWLGFWTRPLERTNLSNGMELL